MSKREDQPLDDLWSRAVRRRDHDTCQRCGRRYPTVILEAHHAVMKRRFTATRWIVANGETLCKFDCHVWAEANPKAAAEWFIERHGAALYHTLRRLGETIQPRTPAFRAEMREKLMAELNQNFLAL